MSAYGRQMERDYSAHTLSRRGNSEMGSLYAVESGFYMTTFVATLFVTGLITLGVLLIALLVALAAMLHSCQSRSGGVVEIQRSYGYSDCCRIYALHAELNKLEPASLASYCTNLSVDHTSGQYEEDFKISLLLVERYFNSVQPLNDGADVILVDIDDIVPSIPHHSNSMRNTLYKYSCRNCFEQAKDYRQFLFLRLYTMLRASNWSLILLSQKPDKLRNATIEHLTSAGYGGWFSMIMRLDDEMEMDGPEYFAKQRVSIQKAGFRISAIISSHLDVLVGPSSGQRVFKLPNPIYYGSKNHGRNVYFS